MESRTCNQQLAFIPSPMTWGGDTSVLVGCHALGYPTSTLARAHEAVAIAVFGVQIAINLKDAQHGAVSEMSKRDW